MKRLEFILLIFLAACSPVTEKIESNIVVPRIHYTGGADNASYSEAKLIKEGKCLYLEHADGSKVLPIFATKTIDWNTETKSLKVDSDTYFLGDKVAYGGGGSYPLEKNNYSWITEVDHGCDTSQVIVINKLIRPIEELPK
ncbi:MAG: hypothetical protein ACK4IX_11265 [Candidatus Sericytochromatia bacterium]|jgi:hypothetical protein|uniref:hypothetical protein n=1 Tax=Acinetobacter TaxID=469 RepID=UPI0015D39451|nr:MULTISPECIES: hypothetical protein [Acinetobacter]MBE9402293.1 hypothetical protein [Acinetobacter albensis]